MIFQFFKYSLRRFGPIVRSWLKVVFNIHKETDRLLIRKLDHPFVNSFGMQNFIFLRYEIKIFESWTLINTMSNSVGIRLKA